MEIFSYGLNRLQLRLSPNEVQKLDWTGLENTSYPGVQPKRQYIHPLPVDSSRPPRWPSGPWAQCTSGEQNHGFTWLLNAQHPYSRMRYCQDSLHWSYLCQTSFGGPLLVHSFHSFWTFSSSMAFPRTLLLTSLVMAEYFPSQPGVPWHRSGNSDSNWAAILALYSRIMTLCRDIGWPTSPSRILQLLLPYHTLTLCFPHKYIIDGMNCNIPASSHQWVVHLVELPTTLEIPLWWVSLIWQICNASNHWARIVIYFSVPKSMFLKLWKMLHQCWIHIHHWWLVELNQNVLHWNCCLHKPWVGKVIAVVCNGGAKEWLNFSTYFHYLIYHHIDPRMDWWWPCLS